MLLGFTYWAGVVATVCSVWVSWFSVWFPLAFAWVYAFGSVFLLAHVCLTAWVGWICGGFGVCDVWLAGCGF